MNVAEDRKHGYFTLCYSIVNIQMWARDPAIGSKELVSEECIAFHQSSSILQACRSLLLSRL
jgi:hypothetical protein